MGGGNAVDEVRDSLVDTCSALRDIYDGLRPAIEQGFQQVAALLDREEAYEYRVWFTDEWCYIAGSPKVIVLQTQEQVDSYLQLRHPDTGDSAVERWERELTPGARAARTYAEENEVFRLNGHVGDFEVISAAIETPLTLGEAIVRLADNAIDLDGLKTRVDDAHKGGDAGPNDHPVDWSGIGYDAYVETRGTYSTTLDGLVSVADDLTQAAGRLLSSINDFLLSLAELGSTMKSDLLDLVSGLADSLNPVNWLGILQTFTGAIDDARENRETLLRDMASAAAGNIQSLTDLMPTAREVSGGWPKVDGNINPAGTGGWQA